ncbi:MAG: hypothetical protein HYT72_03090 [Candidatus Aenigmarchaeota archaeon]|nr:hypothetical protein [Candidatus Aenigmarchaeota archaeon]
MVGVLLIGYGARECSIADAFSRSPQKPDLYIADRQKNPFNVAIAKEHAVIPNLDVGGIVEFAKKHKDQIDFGIVGPENPIINGVRDEVEKLGVPMICPTREFALEGSKARQRLLLEECCPEANPRFKIFDSKDYASTEEAKKELVLWLEELDNKVAVKPDKPALGKGVGVWGDHFNTREQIIEHFFSIYPSPVIVEEKIDGEEFSLQFFTDGFNLVPAPAVRDYKRAFDNDAGPNTGGMGSYKDAGNILPFMTNKDLDDATATGKRIFKKLGPSDGLRGIMYLAFTCAEDGLKVFEINSRLGMPEAQCIMPVLKDDFVEVCFDMINGNVKNMHFDKKATVATYKVPPTYGGKERVFENRAVDLTKALELKSKYGDDIRIYPCSMEVTNGKTRAMNSRTVCAVGIADSIQAAREISLDGINAVKGDLWNRTDIASAGHIKKSIENMKRLRRMC